MTNEEIIKIAQDSIMYYYGVDDPESKAYALAVNEATSPEAKALLKECTIVDTCSFYIETDNWHLQESGVTAMNMTVPNVLDDMGQAVKAILDHYEVANKYPERFKIIETTADIRECKATGKVGLILGAQSCKFIEHSDLYASAEVFAKMGLRVLQIGYNQRTFASEGCLSGEAGLSLTGKVLIKALEKAGITVDLSHVGARSALEALDIAETPVFSHSNPRALFDHPRNISDEAIKKCAAKGGVIGICSYVPILWNRKELPSINGYVDAIAYVADLVGIDHVGIGVDSNAQPGAYDRKDMRHLMDLVPPNRDVYLAGAEAGLGKASAYPAGLYSLANNVNIIDTMLKRGFSHEDVKKVMGENWMRVFAKTWRNG
nr:membrane dipeptidase [uncultured Oscillibacter sp.]